MLAQGMQANECIFSVEGAVSLWLGSRVHRLIHLSNLQHHKVGGQMSKKRAQLIFSTTTTGERFAIQ